MRGRINRRAALLVLIGAGWIWYGWTLISPGPADSRSLLLLTTLFPITRWAWAWIIAGVVAIVCAPLRRPRWDDAGFVAIALPPMLWAASAVGSSLWLHTTPRGASWAVIAGAVLLAAGGIEPRKPQ